MSVNLEQLICDYCKDGKCENLTAFQISHKLGIRKYYGARSKQLVGMAIGRLRKKEIYIRYKN